MLTIKIENDTFQVGINGEVFQPRRVSSTVIDNVRYLASQEYLLPVNRKHLSAAQAKHWARVNQVSMAHERGSSKGAPLHP